MNKWVVLLAVALLVMVAVFASTFFDQKVPAPGEPGYQAPPGSSTGSGKVTVTVVNNSAK